MDILQSTYVFRSSFIWHCRPARRSTLRFHFSACFHGYVFDGAKQTMPRVYMQKSKCLDQAYMQQNLPGGARHLFCIVLLVVVRVVGPRDLDTHPASDQVSRLIHVVKVLGVSMVYSPFGCFDFGAMPVFFLANTPTGG